MSADTRKDTLSYPEFTNPRAETGGRGTQKNRCFQRFYRSFRISPEEYMVPEEDSKTTYSGAENRHFLMRTMR
jgi:hypothetical protein